MDEIKIVTTPATRSYARPPNPNRQLAWLLILILIPLWILAIDALYTRYQVHNFTSQFQQAFTGAGR